MLGGIKPPEPPKSESKDDISRGKLEIVKKEEDSVIHLVAPDRNWVLTPLNDAFLGVSSLRKIEFPGLHTIRVSESAYNEARDSEVVHLESGQTIKREKHFKTDTFPIISTVTPGTDIRATNTIGPNFSRRQQKDIEE